MRQLDPNYQIVYFHHHNAMGVSMNLMSFGFEMFVRTKRWERIDELKILCESFNPTVPPDLSVMSEFAFNNLLDSIKITICFENFMKSFLLLNDFLVHKLDKSQFKELNKEQFIRPIKFQEVRAISEWEINHKINAAEEGLKYQIKGILPFTIGMRELMSPGYQATFKIKQEIINICRQFFEYRNTHHLYIEEQFVLRKQDYQDFLKVVDFLNKNLVRIHNEVVDQLQKGESYKLKPLQY